MPKSRRNSARASRISRKILRQFPLPEPSDHDDKSGRGRVLLVGGAVALPGALVLAGIAALRAGAGKLQIATCRSIAASIGIAIPESLSVGLDETRDGLIAQSAASALGEMIEKTDAVLIGPGMKGEPEELRFVLDLFERCTRKSVVLDAGAISALSASPPALQTLEGNTVITPNPVEMSRVLAIKEEEILEDPERISLDAARTLNAVVALKGSRTFIASPDGDLFRYDSGDVGLATSGSGDILAGIIAGLIARGADPLHAAIWAVFLHGSAGEQLTERVGRIGYLARELLDEIPLIMNRP